MYQRSAVGCDRTHRHARSAQRVSIPHRSRFAHSRSRPTTLRVDRPVPPWAAERARRSQATTNPAETLASTALLPRAGIQIPLQNSPSLPAAAGLAFVIRFSRGGMMRRFADRTAWVVWIAVSLLGACSSGDTGSDDEVEAVPFDDTLALSSADLKLLGRADPDGTLSFQKAPAKLALEQGYAHTLGIRVPAPRGREHHAVPSRPGPPRSVKPSRRGQLLLGPAFKLRQTPDEPRDMAWVCATEALLCLIPGPAVLFLVSLGVRSGALPGVARRTQRHWSWFSAPA
jgi:hypothetical protein